MFLSPPCLGLVGGSAILKGPLIWASGRPAWGLLGALVLPLVVAKDVDLGVGQLPLVGNL